MRPTHLSFYLDHEVYALPLSQVREIIGLSPWDQQPGDLGGLRGVMELHGALIAAIDLREPHGVPALLHGRFMVAIVVQSKDATAGLLVDGIGEVLSVPEHEITQVPAGQPAVVARELLSGRWHGAGRTVLLVDAERVLQEEPRSRHSNRELEI
jgi:purine-binding chemotaxis protein CheW